jgi:hypothetical protein
MGRIDGAIGTLLDRVSASIEVCSIGKIGGTTRAVEKMAVRKHGRTTGYAEGLVTDELIDALVNMNPDDPNAVALSKTNFALSPLLLFQR